MLTNSLKKLVRTFDPIFEGTDDPKVFNVQVTPYYLQSGKEIRLPTVTLAKVRIVDDEDSADANFTVWNAAMLGYDVIFVQFIV